MSAAASGRVPEPDASRIQPLKPLDLLRALARHDVEFVVIGAFSLAAHGYVRGTKDLDIFPEPSRANLARLASALLELDAEPIALEDFRPEELPVALDVDGLSAGGNWLLRTPLGRLDVMQYVAGVDRYEDLRASAVAFDVPGLGLAPLFAGYDQVIAMKQAAGRDQDLIDIAELERARGAGG